MSCRYIRVRYEDLVDQTNTTLAELYHHLAIPYTQHVQRVAFSRTHAENITGTNGWAELRGNVDKTLYISRSGYYNTFRKSNFAHDSWKKKLSLTQIRNIETGCQDFMKANNYAAFS